uniref:Aa_trans domain-containing protein n=1 Tax=Macrostomum lignano TaxID=282301 RepID=A0A1I8I7Q8_9PLAT
STFKRSAAQAPLRHGHEDAAAPRGPAAVPRVARRLGQPGPRVRRSGAGHPGEHPHALAEHPLQLGPDSRSAGQEALHADDRQFAAASDAAGREDAAEQREAPGAGARLHGELHSSSDRRTEPLPNGCHDNRDTLPGCPTKRHGDQVRAASAAGRCLSRQVSRRTLTDLAARARGVFAADLLAAGFFSTLPDEAAADLVASAAFGSRAAAVFVLEVVVVAVVFVEPAASLVATVAADERRTRPSMALTSPASAAPSLARTSRS